MQPWKILAMFLESVKIKLHHPGDGGSPDFKGRQPNFFIWKTISISLKIEDDPNYFSK
jgi:hypothetical protein